MLDESVCPTRLAEVLTRASQDHLIAHAATLPESKRKVFERQLDRVDWELLQGLVHQAAEPTGGDSLVAAPSSPPAIRLAERADAERRRAAVERGRRSLEQGETAVMLVAGGQATRLGCDDPKGMQQVGPVSGATLFQMFCEQVLARGRAAGCKLPLLVMTSDATDDATRAFLESHDRFGIAAEDLHVFRQGTMPCVDEASGRLLLSAPGEIAKSPDGHGGLLAALTASGALQRLHERGIRRLYYAQIDNPLTTLADPEVLGWHLAHGSEMTTLAVAKARPDERVGAPAMVDGRLHVIEYSDLAEGVAAARGDDGGLRLWAGNIAVHVMELDFLTRIAESADALPFHAARKTIDAFDPATGERRPSRCLKFERFIFDVLPRASRPLVIEVDRADAFAPLKNAPGSDEHAPEHVRAAISARARRWLESRGAQVAGEPVEISPLLALGPEDLAGKISANAEIPAGAYLRPDAT